MSDERIPPGWTHDGEWLHVTMPIEPSHDKRRPPDPTPGAIPAEGRFIEHPVGGKHQCPLPQQWSMGALWQCPEGHLWVVDGACDCRDMRGHDQAHTGMHSMGLAWWPATRWQRRKYGPGMKRADLSMAPRSDRKQYGAPPSPPRGPSGVSHPPTDFDG